MGEAPQGSGYPPAQTAQPYTAPTSLPTNKFQALCVAGVIIMACGVIVIASSQFMVDLETGDYDRNAVRNVALIGEIVILVGTILLVLGLMMAGFYAMSRSLGEGTHKGLFAASVLIIGLIIGLTFMLVAFFALA
ncbi:MAG: hypothetical protein JSV43_07830 [Methanobacteriota archaeon]|nr:MAG: hypothetical protein JSV43_07830 [Euryarchaeota archaeon]